MARSWNIIFVTLFATVNSCVIISSRLVHSPTCTNTSQNATLKAPQNVLFKHSKAEIQKMIRLQMYKGAVVEVFPMDFIEKLDAAIEHAKPLVLYIPGFLTKLNDESVQTMVGAHLRRGRDNIMVLDWSAISAGHGIRYDLVHPNVEKVAAVAAETFDALFHKGLNLATFHCVGHSLGAQICGCLGRTSKNVIPRITGLDPAWPSFQTNREHINKNDAKFVDILHTDGGGFGFPHAIGTVDFFANEGKRSQPGCATEYFDFFDTKGCSHGRAWRLYAESVLDQTAFTAYQCDSWKDFITEKCFKNPWTYYGSDTRQNTRGSFIFSTADKSPFSGKVAHA